MDSYVLYPLVTLTLYLFRPTNNGTRVLPLGAPSFENLDAALIFVGIQLLAEEVLSFVESEFFIGFTQNKNSFQDKKDTESKYGRPVQSQGVSLNYGGDAEILGAYTSLVWGGITGHSKTEINIPFKF